MSDDPNARYVNKYIRVLKEKYDNLNNDILNMEVSMSFLREAVEEKDKEIVQLREEVEKLKKQKKPSSRSTKTEPVKEETTGF